MTIEEQIKNQLKNALKEKNAELATSLRQLLSAIKNEAIALMKKDEGLSDEEVINVLKREKKKREDSISLYREGNREDLAEKEQKELELINEFLPAEMSDEEIKAVVDKVIAEADDKSFGKIMGQVMKEVGSRADGSRVKKIVEESLNS